MNQAAIRSPETQVPALNLGLEGSIPGTREVTSLVQFAVKRADFKARATGPAGGHTFSPVTHYLSKPQDSISPRPTRGIENVVKEQANLENYLKGHIERTGKLTPNFSLTCAKPWLHSSLAQSLAPPSVPWLPAPVTLCLVLLHPAVITSRLTCCIFVSLTIFSWREAPWGQGPAPLCSLQCPPPEEWLVGAGALSSCKISDGWVTASCALPPLPQRWLRMHLSEAEARRKDHSDKTGGTFKSVFLSRKWAAGICTGLPGRDSIQSFI